MSDLDVGILFNVNGLVAVITGGGSGIGLMAAKALDANGAKKVYIIGRRKATLEAAAAQAINGNIVPLVGDVTSKESLQKCVDQIKSEVGYVNVVFANSGTLGVKLAGGVQKPTSVKEYKDTMWEHSMEDFTNTLHVNITGVYFTILAFLELLDEGNKSKNVKQKSQVIVTSSVGAYARVPLAGVDYNASKAGVLHLVKILCTQFAPFSIRVNTIAPGLFHSEMTDAHPMMAGQDKTIEGSIPIEMLPLARAGSEKDMAGAILFLMSEAGAYMNGNVLVTDGGRLGVIPNSY